MATWEAEYHYYPNPQAHATIERIRRQRALRRARACVDMPVEQKVEELLAAGFTQQEIAD